MKVLFRTIDIETTGMEPPHEVIEFGWSDVPWETDTGDVDTIFSNGMMFGASKPMTADVVAVHHIQDRDIAGLPLADAATFQMLATTKEPRFLVAHNSDFERKWITDDLIGEARWICTYKVALRLYPDAPSHSNQALRYFLGLDLAEEDAMPPHRARPDSFVTAHILARMLKDTTVKQMVIWTLEPRYYATCPLGKHKGNPWSTVPHDYLTWMLKQQDMETDIKHAAHLEIERRRGEPA